MKLTHLRTALITGAALIGMICPAAAQTHQTPEEVAADIARNGAYSQRHNPRIVGAPAVPPQAVKPTVIPGSLITDPATRETNELVVLLNYESSARLSQLVPGYSASASAPALERAFQGAANAKSPSASLALGNPLHVRSLLEGDRMRDSDRAAQAWLTKSGGARAANPRERLERYFVVRYDSIELAKLALERLKKDPAIAYASMNRVATPSANATDAYFAERPGLPKYYQWGLKSMLMADAWDVATGGAYVGVVDQGWPGKVVASTPFPSVTLVVHPDLQRNFRRHMAAVNVINENGAGYNHTVHVAGIIAAEQNNTQTGVVNSGYIAGACGECSFAAYPLSLASGPGPTSANYADQIRRAVEGGMQVINLSVGFPIGPGSVPDCSSHAEVCDALYFAGNRDVLSVVSSGNYNRTAPQFPADTHDGSMWSFMVLPVGGTNHANARYDLDVGVVGAEKGSNHASSKGVMGPGLSVPSTFTAGESYSFGSTCADTNTGSTDESSGAYANGVGDGVGSCTGTSMAAPHITALAGLMRSLNPRMYADDLRAKIRGAGDRAGNPNSEYGYGLPYAYGAVQLALATNSTRLTPLFSYFSSSRQDSFYTTVPQMGRAAALGTMRPRVSANFWDNQYAPAYGNWITGYSIPSFGGGWGGDTSTYVKAEVWIFTSSHNPKVPSAPLRPLYRVSFKCGDVPSNPPACSSYPHHVDTVLVDKAEIAFFQSLGYQVDGLEGYVYPKDQAQPIGTVKLMRKYNQARDDHAMFPDTATGTMASDGYTTYTNNTDWLGYAYPNNGSIPLIQ